MNQNKINLLYLCISIKKSEKYLNDLREHRDFFKGRKRLEICSMIEQEIKIEEANLMKMLEEHENGVK
ncbi:MAG: hypothetical protein U9O94_01275 [Nanoarchaeota archaeon]|nr:hypothetical protein [Nanoarchaeota archaeon]